MSRLYFHTESTTAEVAGREAHWLPAIPKQIAQGWVNFARHDDLHERLLPGSHMRNIRFTHDLYEAIRLEISVGMHGPQFCDEDGTPLSTIGLVLNTALKVCSDPVALATRIGAQCGIHCFIEEQDHPWAAELLRQGRHSGVLREGAGWDGVIELLCDAEGAPGPVVCSYSTTDGFPNPDMGIAGGWTPPELEDGELDHEAWYGLSDAEQWTYSVAGIRELGGLQISPGTLRETFGHNRSFIDLFVSSPARRG